MDKAMLITEEFGFDVINAFDWAVDLGERLSKIYDFIFKEEKSDQIVNELDKGYFTELYNQYSEIENPKKEDLENLKKSFIDEIKRACAEIESVFHKHINITREKITIDKIIKYLKLNEK